MRSSFDVIVRAMWGLCVRRLCERTRLCRGRGTVVLRVRCGRGLCVSTAYPTLEGTRSNKITPADATRAML